MSLVRKGVKVGKYDVRMGVSKKRAQALLRKLGVLEDDKGRKKFEKDGMGDVQTIRTIVGMGEGFTMPVNFRCSFHQLNMGIDQPKYSPGTDFSEAEWAGTNEGQVKRGSLDWRTHIMQNSTRNLFLERYKQANAAAQGMYKKIEGKALKRDE